MSILEFEDRLSVLEMVTEIASKAAQNPNVEDMVGFQEELVERLYRKMTSLLEEDALGDDDDEDDD
ncbi:hypothetical protein [Thiohalocapsa sp. ML1]|jgi:hypothetical protein|uniref:hypothetical protein n=1 Tax=Thiohalocapsa sp. ML1 TaxID=1431688 RepID=UPI00073242D1|nr:hypothetical protein [Thiohalocapsa sp. ML1]